MGFIPTKIQILMVKIGEPMGLGTACAIPASSTESLDGKSRVKSWYPGVSRIDVA